MLSFWLPSFRFFHISTSSIGICQIIMNDQAGHQHHFNCPDPSEEIISQLMSGSNQSFLGENYLAMSLVSVSEKLFVFKFLQEKRKFLPVFSGSRITKSNKQKLNCRCQELDPRHFIVSLCLPGGFLLYFMSFYPV